MSDVLEQVRAHMLDGTLTMRGSNVAAQLNDGPESKAEWTILAATLICFVQGAHCCRCGKVLGDEDVVLRPQGTMHATCVEVQ